MAAGTPTIWYPTGTPAGIRLDDRLIAIKAPYSGDGAQSEVQWQISAAADFATTVYDSTLHAPDDWTSGDDWIEVPLALLALAASTTYYVRCRVRNDEVSPVTSSWSASATFVTEAARVAAATWADQL